MGVLETIVVSLFVLLVIALFFVLVVYSGLEIAPTKGWWVILLAFALSALALFWIM